jgi:hypothetical protein
MIVTIGYIVQYETVLFHGCGGKMIGSGQTDACVPVRANQGKWFQRRGHLRFFDIPVLMD